MCTPCYSSREEDDPFLLVKVIAVVAAVLIVIIAIAVSTSNMTSSTTPNFNDQNYRITHSIEKIDGHTYKIVRTNDGVVVSKRPAGVE